MYRCQGCFTRSLITAWVAFNLIMQDKTWFESSLCGKMRRLREELEDKLGIWEGMSQIAEVAAPCFDKWKGKRKRNFGIFSEESWAVLGMRTGTYRLVSFVSSGEGSFFQIGTKPPLLLIPHVTPSSLFGESWSQADESGMQHIWGWGRAAYRRALMQHTGRKTSDYLNSPNHLHSAKHGTEKEAAQVSRKPAQNAAAVTRQSHVFHRSCQISHNARPLENEDLKRRNDQRGNNQVTISLNIFRT